MNGKILIILSVAIAIFGFVLYGLLQSADEKHVPQGTQNTSFDEIAPDLYRLGRTWELVKKYLEVHISVFLIKSGKDFILIDTGVPGTNYTDLIIRSARAATEHGNLRMILRESLFN